MSHLLSQILAHGVTPKRLCSDSRRVQPGDLFLAYPGERVDGRHFIAEAIARGAVAVLWESAAFDWPLEWVVAHQPVSGLRDHLGEIAAAFYGEPGRKLQMVGVTGTNGKTTCTHWLAQVLNHLHRPTAVIGTLGNGLPDALHHTKNTTPDALLLHGMLADYLAQGVQTVAMEVSSHSLVQGRVNGVPFEVAVFTNLTRDHLDYHQDMVAYAEAKRRLFECADLRWGILNRDDPFSVELEELLLQRGVQVLRYGLQDAEVYACEVVLDQQGLQMILGTPDGEAPLTIRPFWGRFNIHNLLAVVAAALACGVAWSDIVQTLPSLQAVAGRMQRVGQFLPLVVIDYAHTPDALKQALLSLREQVTGRLICVFGCGGNRDTGKRRLMGEVASTLADRVVVTSDNPRDEHPAHIIAEIMAGVAGHCEVEEDRAKAIRQAIQSADKQDVILIAGKGHEEYQEIAGQKYPFSDWLVAHQVLEEVA